MLIGEYTHSLDAKRRLSLPVKFRKELGKKVVITHGLDSCLFVYPIKQWEKVTEKLMDGQYIEGEFAESEEENQGEKSGLGTIKSEGGELVLHEMKVEHYLPTKNGN